MTLGEFLLARTAEDEANAVNIHDTFACDSIPCNCGVPEAIRAGCEANRQIVEWHTATEECCESRWGPMRFDADPTVSVGADSWGGLVTRRSIGHQVRLGCVTLMLLALPYAGHPDYRQEWKP